MSDFEPIDQQAYTPSREEIKNFGTSHSTTEDDLKIQEEAKRRFGATFQSVDPVAFVSKFEGLEDDEEAGPDWEISQECIAPEVIDFVRRVTVLRIANNQKLDRIVAGRVELNSTEDEVKRQELNVKFQADARKIYGELTKNPFDEKLKKIRHDYPDIDKYEDEDDLFEHVSGKIANEYLLLLEDGSNFAVQNDYEPLGSINVDAYIALGAHIGDSCVNNSYLENLFLTLSKEPHKEKTKDEIFLERLKGVEQKARSYIKSIYNVDLPPVTYIKDEGWTQQEFIERVLDAPNEPLARHVGSFAYSADENGLRHVEQSIEVKYDSSDTFISNAGTVFEELYHASGLPLMQQNQGKLFPGWNPDDGTEALFEEGLAALEKDVFLQLNYKDEYSVPGSPIDLIRRYSKSENPQGKIHDFWPETLARILLKSYGRDFIYDMRQARAKGNETLDKVQTKIDGIFGDGTYQTLSQLSGHNITESRNAALSLYKKSNNL